MAVPKKKKKKKFNTLKKIKKNVQKKMLLNSTR